MNEKLVKVKQKLTQPLKYGPNIVRLSYLLVGGLTALVIRGGPKEIEVTRWKTKTEVQYVELDNSKVEQKDTWVYRPDGTKEVTRYRLNLTKISNRGRDSREAEKETEIIKEAGPQYSIAAGLALSGDPMYWGEFGMRLGETPLWAVVGFQVPQDAFKIQGSRFTLGIRLEF